jgi:hypothetical protein
MQHLLAGARWDADGVRDDLRGYVAGHLGDAAGHCCVGRSLGSVERWPACPGQIVRASSSKTVRSRWQAGTSAAMS